MNKTKPIHTSTDKGIQLSGIAKKAMIAKTV